MKELFRVRSSLIRVLLSRALFHTVFQHIKIEIGYVYIFSKRSDILDNNNNEEDEDISVIDPTQND
jgi:hypothetical protein